ncbi:15794_t:CDS:2, partial [Cetraspora pellucida]
GVIQKTFEETTPQDMYIDLQHESGIFISDLEILNDGASFQETFMESMPQDMYMDLENLDNVMSSQETLRENRFLKGYHLRKLLQK